MPFCDCIDTINKQGSKSTKISNKKKSPLANIQTINFINSTRKQIPNKK